MARGHEPPALEEVLILVGKQSRPLFRLWLLTRFESMVLGTLVLKSEVHGWSQAFEFIVTIVCSFCSYFVTAFLRRPGHFD